MQDQELFPDSGISCVKWLVVFVLFCFTDRGMKLKLFIEATDTDENVLWSCRARVGIGVNSRANKRGEIGDWLLLLIITWEFTTEGSSSW